MCVGTCAHGEQLCGIGSLYLYVGSRDQTQVISLLMQTPHPLSHLASPHSLLKITVFPQVLELHW